MIDFIQIHLDEENKHGIEHVEQSVFHGIDKIKSSIELIGNDSEAQKILRMISVRTVNEIATNKTYNRQIMSKIKIGQRINDTAAMVKHIVISVESDLNRKIESSKRSDIRYKRSKEKTLVLNWYRTNKDELKKLLDLYNIFITSKKNVSKS